jgi:hypothetical protein
MLLLNRSYSGVPVEFVGHNASHRLALEQNEPSLWRSDD